MNITALIPTRGDRAEFLDKAVSIVETQTVKPKLIISKAPLGVTGNVRSGYEKVKDGLVFIFEDDDYYPADYIEQTLKHYNGEDLIGYNQTVYYHLGLKKYRKMVHNNRSSLFQTAIKAGLHFDWPPNDVNFLDLKLWANPYFNKKLINGHYAIGMKHGIGKTGGSAHQALFPYEHRDDTHSALNVMTLGDPFYIELSNKLWETQGKLLKR